MSGTLAIVSMQVLKGTLEGDPLTMATEIIGNAEVGLVHCLCL
jgi:hypothetical protein